MVFAAHIIILLWGVIFVQQTKNINGASFRAPSILAAATMKAKARTRGELGLVTEPQSSGIRELFKESQLEVNLWIVGCGKLGVLVAKKWLQLNPSDVVVGETLTTHNHHDIAAVGAIPRLRSERFSGGFKYTERILISIPPYSKSPDTASRYIKEVKAALDLPKDLMLNAPETCTANEYKPVSPPTFLLVSSTSVYGSPLEDRQVVTETSPVANSSNDNFKRAQSSVMAEEIVLHDNSGSVIRLAGLYEKYKGPHVYWLSNINRLKQDNSVPLNIEPNELVNLIHYDDAGDATVKALLRGGRGEIYLASDDQPLSRREIIETAINADIIPGLKSTKISDIFSSNNSPTRSKICKGEYTRQVLKWRPKYKFTDISQIP